MDIVLNRLTRTFLWCLKQRPHVDVKTQVSKGRGHYFGTAVVSILAQFCNHHAGATTVGFTKCSDLTLQGIPPFGGIISGSVHTSHLLRIGAVAPKNFLKCIAHLAHGRAQANGVDAQGQQVALTRLGTGGQGVQCLLHGGLVTSRPNGFELCDLLIAHLHVVDF